MFTLPSILALQQQRLNQNLPKLDPTPSKELYSDLVMHPSLRYPQAWDRLSRVHTSDRSAIVLMIGKLVSAELMITQQVSFADASRMFGAKSFCVSARGDPFYLSTGNVDMINAAIKLTAQVLTQSPIDQRIVYAEFITRHIPEIFTDEYIIRMITVPVDSGRLRPVRSPSMQQPVLEQQTFPQTVERDI